jgi:hypothetical protein
VDRLTIKQTATGYWVVQQGATHLASAMTRKAAEAERHLLNQLRGRKLRRGSREPEPKPRATTGPRLF